MANEVEAFRLGKLLAIVRRIGHSRLFRVQLVGQDDELVTHLYAKSAEEAAVDLVQELHFANNNPEAFYIRRREWIRQVSPDRQEKKAEWAHVHEIFEYARRNVLPLWQADESIRQAENRRVI